MKSTPQQQRNNNNNKKKKRVRKRTPNRGANSVRSVPRAVVRDCTRHYLGVLTNPFGYFNNGVEVCIPDLNSRPSYKVQTIQRGVFTVGTGGAGFVAANPLAAFTGLNNVCFSVTNYAGSGIDCSGVANTSTATYSTAPFPDTATRLARLVGAGLRIRYIGTELNKSGLQVGATLASAIGQTLQGLDYIQLASRPDSRRTSAVTRQWSSVTWVPTDEDLCDWNSTTTNDWATLSSTNSRMGFVVNGQPGNSYEWEFIAFREFISTGTRLVPGVTASHSDVEGISAVKNFLGTVWNSEPGQQLYSAGMNYVYNYLTGVSDAQLEMSTTQYPAIGWK